MKTWKKALALLLAAALVIPGVDFSTLLQVSAAGQTETTDGGTVVTPEGPEGIAVSPADATMKVGDELELSVTVVTPSDAVSPDNGVVWESSDETKATVDRNGKVKAVSPTDGDKVVTITATAKYAPANQAEKAKATCKIKIVKAGDESNPSEIKVQSITVTGSNTVGVGQTTTEPLVATVSPYNASNKAVTWSSEDTTKATVSEDGKVTGVAEGKAVIKATAKDGSGVSGQLEVTVTKEAAVTVTGVTVDAAKKTIKVGEETQATATVAPAEANQAVTWTSADNTIATVDATGKIKGVAAGKVKIIATSVADTTKSGEVEITVDAEDPAVTVTGVKVEAAAEVEVGKTITAKATVEPAGANQAVTWESSDKTKATVDDKGVITGVAAGEVTITAKSVADPAKSGTAKVTVKAAPVTDVKVTGITLKADKKTIKVGAKTTVKATVAPENATNKELTWTMDNKAVKDKIATIKPSADTQSVTVTAKKAGTLKLTATAKDGSGKTATISIKIEKKVVKVKSVKLSADYKIAKVGSKVKLTATVAPKDATKKAVEWKTSDKKLATVKKGVVTINKKAKLKKKGKTYVTITATATDGSKKKATVKIEIVKKVTVKKVKVTGAKTVKAGKKVTLKATLTPAIAGNKGVTWKTSNKKWATVSSKGVVASKKAGKGKTVKITATSKDNKKKKATISIKIKK